MMHTNRITRRTPPPLTRAAWASAAVVFAVLAFFPAALGAVHVQLELNPPVLSVGETAEGKMTVRNLAQPPEPRWPDIDGLIIRPAGIQVQHTLHQGTLRRAQVFLFWITAGKEGTYSLAPETYRVEGAPIPIEPVSVRVIPAQNNDASVFARMELENTQLYVQQSFPVTLALYSRSDIELTSQIHLDDLPREGLEWGRFQEMAGTRAHIGDHMYQVRRFRGRARALAPGSYRIAPTLHVQERVRDMSRRTSPMERIWPEAMFNDPSRTRSRPIVADAAEIDIRPLPEQGKPSNFSGAVGHFSLHAEVDRTETEVGEPVSIRLTIQGEGNPDLVRAPVFEDDPSFRPYAPRLIEHDYDVEQGRGRKVFEIVLVPRAPDITEIPALSFSFFHPDTGRYQTLVRGPFPLTVHPAPSDVHAVLVSPREESPPARTADLKPSGVRYLKPEPRRWIVPRPPSRARRLMVDLAPLLIGGLLAGVGRRRVKQAEDPAYARKIQAPRTFRKALRNAGKAAKHGDSPTFFHYLRTGIGAYFGSRLHLPPGEVTGAQIIAAALRANVNPNTRAALQTMMDRVDAARYGGGDEASKEEMKSILNVARTIRRESERLKW